MCVYLYIRSSTTLRKLVWEIPRWLSFVLHIRTFFRAQSYIYTYVRIYFNGLNIFRFVRTYDTMGKRMTIRTRHTQTKLCTLSKILARANNIVILQRVMVTHARALMNIQLCWGQTKFKKGELSQFSF